MSSWYRAASHLLRPLSVLSLRRTRAEPTIPSDSLLQPLLDLKKAEGPEEGVGGHAVFKALVSLRSYEEEAQSYLHDARRSPGGERLVLATLARAYLRSFAAVFRVLQLSPRGLHKGEDEVDLQLVLPRVLRGFFRVWQAALKIVTASSDERYFDEAEVDLAEVHQSLDGFGLQLPHSLQPTTIPESVEALLARCSFTPLIETAVAFIAAQQHQPPRPIAPAPGMNHAAPPIIHDSPVSLQLGLLFDLLTTLEESLEMVPSMQDTVCAGSDGPEGVAQRVAHATERPMELGLGLRLLKTDFALSIAVELVRSMPRAALKPVARGKRSRSSLSSSQSQSCSNQGRASSSGEDAGLAGSPQRMEESYEERGSRLEREGRELEICQWGARADISLATSLGKASQLISQGKTHLLTKASAMELLLRQAELKHCAVGVSPEFASLPDSVSPASSSASDESSSSEESGISTVNSTGYVEKPKAISILFRLAQRFFEWRIGRWESLGLKEKIKRDDYSRGQDGVVGNNWNLLGIQLLVEFSP